ncbi:hypothetical protein BKA65DRAFT_552316 [Rhexocercosporidium sp. MPI-PUGE-AT-0058]|nr:hypothetical protein BKA65DRAFT_552316 [Rhexocercosporidium sp. MPI-PUGE-AT-0058]
MQLFTLMLSIMLLALTTPMVSAGPFVTDHLPAGYTLGKMGFSGEIAGHHISYNGTIEEILAYAETQHPGITKALAARDDVPLDIAGLESSNIVTRSANLYLAGPWDGKGHRYCGKDDCPLCPEWGYAINYRIQEGINYLNKVKATCNASSHQCVRISCSWHSAIHLCNDMEDRVDMPCNWASTFAGDVINDPRCQDPSNDRWDYDWSNGQQWASNRAYNIFVSWANC